MMLEPAGTGDVDQGARPPVLLTVLSIVIV